jgi:hypothetical protein
MRPHRLQGAAAIRTACSSSASWSRCEATATLDQRSKLVFHAEARCLWRPAVRGLSGGARPVLLVGTQSVGA